MKSIPLCLGLLLPVCTVLAGNLPIITVQPQSVSLTPGNNANFAVTADDTTGYQWRRFGTNIAGATTSTLTISNAQAADSGYYMALAKNATGWVPSRPVYLSVGSGGRVPFYNNGNANAQANFQQNCFFGGFPAYTGPMTNVFAQLVAGPTLEEMSQAGATVFINDGYFGSSTPPGQTSRTVPNITPGQDVYCRVEVSYSNTCYGAFTQRSTTLKLPSVATGATLSPIDLRFPIYLEWPEELNILPLAFEYPTKIQTNQIHVPGETFQIACSISYTYVNNNTLSIQWRKDGIPIPGATISALNYLDSIATTSFTVTNLQAADAGVYDFIFSGSYGSTNKHFMVSPKISVSMQLAGGQGVFRSPRMTGSSFVSELDGVPNRNYAIQWSQDLNSWFTLQTVSNASGTVTVTDPGGSETRRFYRAQLLP